jgi:hypothetical protein
MKVIKGFKLANTVLATALALALSGCGDDPVSNNVPEVPQVPDTPDTPDTPTLDTEAPVITLNGADTVNIANGVIYTELGATVSDNVDTGLVVTLGGNTVDTSIDGQYVVTYNVSDAAGNDAVEKTRTVNVVTDLAPVSIITNGDFETALDGEWFFELAGGTPTIIGGELAIVDLSAGGNPWEGRLVQNTDTVLTNGTSYKISFDAKAAVARSINVQLGKLFAADPYFTPVMEDSAVDLTTTMTAYEIVFTANNPDGLTADLIFALGAGADTLVTFDNISITEATGGETGGTDPTVLSAVPAGDIPAGEVLFTFDETDAVTIRKFEGGISDAALVDDGNGNKVLKITKTADAAAWEGATISTGGLSSVPQLMVTATDKILTAKVFSPAAGVRIEVKIENAEATPENKEAFAFTTVANQWETLTWDLTEDSFLNPDGEDYASKLPVAGFNAAYTYNKISFMPDQTRIMDAEASFYIDDVYFQGSLGDALALPVEVTAPTTLPAAPSLAAADVLSLHTSSGTYTNINVTNWSPDWGQASTLTDDTVDGKTVKKLELNNYQGVDFAIQNITGKTTLHMDIYVNEADAAFAVYAISAGDGPAHSTGTFVANSWNEVEIDVSDIPNISSVAQLKFDGSTGNTYWIDNVYFH